MLFNLEIVARSLSAAVLRSVSRYRICAYLLLLLSTPMSGYGDVPESKAALQQLAESVSFKKLSNGMRVIMYRRGTAPVFAGTVTVGVGGVDEPEGRTGIAHLLEHMAFKGTKTLGTSDFSRERPLLRELEELESIKAHGGELSTRDQSRLSELYEELKKIWKTGEFAQQYDLWGGAGLNATTDSELTNYFVELPRNAFDFWCRIESDRLLNPIFRQFYQERDVVMEERRMRVDDDPSGKLYELLMGAAYRIHRYRNPVIGYAADIAHITATDLYNFRQQYYVPENIVLSLVGDIDVEKDLPVIEHYFGSLNGVASVVRTSTVEPQQEGERRVTLEAKAAPSINIAYHKPSYPDKDDAPLSILGHILAGSRTSVMYEELVKRSRKAADVGYSEDPGTKFPNLMLFGATPRAPHSNSDVLLAFDQALNSFIHRGVSDEELTRAQRALAVSYLNRLKANVSLSKDLASSELLYGNWKAVIDWYDQVMAVTPAEINRVAKKYLAERNRTVATLESLQRGAR